MKRSTIYGPTDVGTIDRQRHGDGRDKGLYKGLYKGLMALLITWYGEYGPKTMETTGHEDHGSKTMDQRLQVQWTEDYADYV